MHIVFFRWFASIQRTLCAFKGSLNEQTKMIYIYLCVKSNNNYNCMPPWRVQWYGHVPHYLFQCCAEIYWFWNTMYTKGYFTSRWVAHTLFCMRAKSLLCIKMESVYTHQHLFAMWIWYFNLSHHIMLLSLIWQKT